MIPAGMISRKTRSESADDGCTRNISLQALAHFGSSVSCDFHHAIASGKLGPIILFLVEFFTYYSRIILDSFCYLLF